MRKTGFALASFMILGVVAAPLGPFANRAARAAAGDTLEVIGSGVNVRFGPSINTRIRQQVPRRQQVMELQREGDWVRVEIIDSGGREGWIHGSLLAPPGGEPLVAMAPQAAEPAKPAAAQPGAAAPSATAAAIARPAPGIGGPPTAAAATEDTATDDMAAEDMAAEDMAAEDMAAEDMAAEDMATADVATAPGEVAAIDDVISGTGSAPPAVAQPAAPGPTEPAAIEPAAAPRADSAELARFRQSVDYLNSRAVSVAGVDLFTDVEPGTGGVVQVAATDAWSSIPPAGQQSYANTLLDRWAAARGYGGPVSLQIVDADGKVLLERTRE